MLSDNPARVRLFKKTQSGDGNALADLLSDERSELYDFLMRMTGQQSRSADSVEEVYQSLSDEMMEGVTTYEDFKVLIYQTARKFNADIWNAETARLLNASLDAPAEGGEVTEKVLRERKNHIALDRAVRILPPTYREAMLLRARCGFDHAEIGAIMGLPEVEAESLAVNGLRKVEAECPGLNQEAEDALKKLPHHPPPERSTQATMNLSMVMQGIKTKPVGLRSPARITMVVLIIIGTIAYVLVPDLPRHIAALLSSIGIGAQEPGASGTGTP